jgi:hypothetical protein
MNQAQAQAQAQALPQAQAQALPQPQAQQETMVFQAPFTAILAGPTSCGKTYWMKRLFDNLNTLIRPAPETIIWFYKRWQPIYSELVNTIPNIKFIQGIPPNIGEDSRV